MVISTETDQTTLVQTTKVKKSPKVTQKTGRRVAFLVAFPPCATRVVNLLIRLKENK
jgi:hypothetical protein